MKLFITGGTGYIGRAVVRKAIRLGHQVTALVRDDKSEVAAELIRLGVSLHSGDLSKPETFSATAGAADGVIHAASTNDALAGTVDEAAAVAMLSQMNSGAAFVYTSGTWVYGDTHGEAATEASALNPTPLVAWRPAVEQRVRSLAARRSIAAVILRPAMVHGYGGGVFAMLAGMARQSSSVKLVGNGRGHWPAVHVNDLATAYLSAAERAVSGDVGVIGQIFNVVAEEDIAVSEMVKRSGNRSAPIASNLGRLTTPANRLALSLTHWPSISRQAASLRGAFSRGSPKALVWLQTCLRQATSSK